MKKTITFIAIIALAVALALVSGIGVNKVRAQLAPVKAYQIWTHKATSLSENWDEYAARRSDGTSIETNTAEGLSKLTIPTSGIDVLYSNRNSNIMTVGTGASTLARDFKSDCSDSGLGQPLAGETKNILGCDVLHIAYGDNRMAKSGAREMDHFSHWVAPSLNCYPVEEEFIYYRDGKQYHQESRTLTKVILGEPPADAFKMPTGVETPPSVFRPPVGHQLPQQMAAKQDAFYYRRKAQRSAFRLP